MKPSGAHTHPPAGGSLPAALAVIAIAAIAVAVAGPVVDAIAALLRAVIITGAAAIAVAIAVLVVYRARHPRPGAPASSRWLAGRAVPPPAAPASSRTALGKAGPPVIHLHLCGTSPQDVAEVLARQFLTIDSPDRG